jgi:hypothetical protein
MVNALKWHDQTLAMSACEFWSGLPSLEEFREAADIIEGVSEADPSTAMSVECYTQLKNGLSTIVPELFLCCRFTTAD